MSTTEVGVPETKSLSGPGEETLESAVDKNKTIASSKIMIVDDEPINVKVARKYLNLEGYETSSRPPIRARQSLWSRMNRPTCCCWTS